MQNIHPACFGMVSTCLPQGHFPTTSAASSTPTSPAPTMTMERAAPSSACNAAYSSCLSLQVACLLGVSAPARLATVERYQGKQADLLGLNRLDGRSVVAAEAE